MNLCCFSLSLSLHRRLLVRIWENFAGESNTIYVIYRGYYDFDRDGQSTWQQGWTSFEDKFEDSSSQ
jgi:hypothetical protein